jgi:hypothetical protein
MKCGSCYTSVALANSGQIELRIALPNLNTCLDSHCGHISGVVCYEQYEDFLVCQKNQPEVSAAASVSRCILSL